MIYALIFVLSHLTLLTLFLWLPNRKRTISSPSRISISEITVIIPFRNEENRIFLLIDSINNLISLPAKFIFVNDHSTDKGPEILEKLRIENWQLINMPAGEEGKKMALRNGINLATTEFVLTWDADIQMNPTYFHELSKQTKADLLILPVEHVSPTFWRNFFSLDLWLTNVLNVAAFKWHHAILASGANLLFRKETFLALDSFQTHRKISSGDDLFLLQDFNLKKKNVVLVNGLNVAVSTEVPETWKAFFEQRIRWISKTHLVKDALSIIIALYQTLVNLTFFGFLFYFLVTAEFHFAAGLFGIKTIGEMLILFALIRSKNKLDFLFFFPFYQVFLPFYTLVLLFLQFTFKPNWKERKITY